jgi:hypothetical protein
MGVCSRRLILPHRSSTADSELVGSDCVYLDVFEYVYCIFTLYSSSLLPVPYYPIESMDSPRTTLLIYRINSGIHPPIL